MVSSESNDPKVKKLYLIKLTAMIFVIGVAALAVFLSGALFWAHQIIEKPLNISTPTTVNIKPGQSLTRVVYDLSRQGILHSHPQVYILYGRVNRLTNIQYGEYRLSPQMGWPQVNALFSEGDVIERSVTLIEGQTIFEALNKLHRAPGVVQQLTNAFDPKLISMLPKDHDHPEGWFFADTYSYRKGDSDLQILARAHKKMRSSLDALWSGRELGLPYGSAYEALVMASIIEKETGLAQERPQIAGVFVRRLNNNMRLQTDPTVIYGLGDEYQGNLKRSHLKQVNDYNTYVIKGLPPTPIALVGQESLNAAFSPATGSALYFVARGDGSHKFSDTLQEHNRAVREYQIERRKQNYQSAPQQ